MPSGGARRELLDNPPGCITLGPVLWGRGQTVGGVGDAGEQSGRVAETVGALCMAAVLLGIVAGLVTGVMAANGEISGLGAPLADRAHLLTFGTTILFAGVLLAGVVIVLLAAAWESRPLSLVGIATLVAAVPLGFLVIAGTGIDMWSYLARPEGHGFWPMILRALAVPPALVATKLAWSKAVHTLQWRSGERGDPHRVAPLTLPREGDPPER